MNIFVARQFASRNGKAGTLKTHTYIILLNNLQVMFTEAFTRTGMSCQSEVAKLYFVEA